ncbi:MAG: GNAT family N-acetyltransferase [Flavobacteriaceae bacterium]|nr:GNAT family N-acetyltransferase [Flavobacteriaceae bacterium]
MKALLGKSVYLRALEPEDLAFLFENENNEEFWNVSNTQKPFSKFTLKKYIENAHLDIYEIKQLRLIIALTKNDEPIGMIDLYDYDPKHKRAGVGILISKSFQGYGFASEALQLLIKYAFNQLDIYQLFACIGSDNIKSIKLFETAQFKVSGIKKDWNFNKGKFHDELFLQLISI